jgi:hypothetical protein
MNPELEAFQISLDKANQLSSLKESPDWAIIDETLTSLISGLADSLLNDTPVTHDEYTEIRYKIEGIRMVISSLQAIQTNGKQAADSIKLING